jgi:transposase
MLFMERLAREYPTGPVIIVWDNLNTHVGPQWNEFNRRHGGRFRFLYTPLHASWVNQVEVWFSILSRRVLKYGDFASLGQLETAVRGFIHHWNEEEAHPFRWKFRGEFKPRRAAQYAQLMAESWRAEIDALEEVEDFLVNRPELAHLRIRRRGPLITLESGPTNDPILHARVRRLSVHCWTLECATHMGRWEPTGERATLGKLLRLAVESYPWVFEPVA